MSKLLYITIKNENRVSLKVFEDSLKKIERRIIPDNITPNKMIKIVSGNSILSVFNPMSTLKIKNKSIALGHVNNADFDEFNKRGSEFNGSFSIFRDEDKFFQVANDVLGSRTVWYYKDDNLFVSSTSQRAIVMCLNSFEFNDKIIPWMLSAGTIGPGYSYDKRISMIPPNSLLTLDKENWELKCESEKSELTNEYTSKSEAKTDLHKALKESFAKININEEKFALPLSGGYDSRGVLLFLRERIKLQTITWGAKESLNIKDNDAFIAKQLADKIKVENKFYESYNPNVSVKEVFNRYLVNSEGRIDHIGGYLDGMQMWKEFFENKHETLIRGEELLGLYEPASYLDARRASGVTILSDYANIDSKLIDKLQKQELPNYNNEDIYKFKGYYAINYEHPIVFAALNDIKTSYAEIYSPLLSSDILSVVFRMFSSDMIGDKQIFKDIIDELCPDIPIAKRGANKLPSDFMKSKPVIDELIKTFRDVEDNDWYLKDLADYAITKIEIKKQDNKPKISITTRLRGLAPNWIIELLKKNVNKRMIDWGSFAFRLYIIIKMKELFTQDAETLTIK